MTNHIKKFTLKNFEGFDITSNFAGTKTTIGDNIGDSIERHYAIQLRNVETGKALKFNYWTSINEPVIASTKELKNAFFCFVDDCCVGYKDYDEFCLDLGYEKDDYSKKVYKGCCLALKKMECIYEGKVDDLYETLLEKYNF